MNVLFKPVSILSGVVAARLSTRLVDRIWGIVDEGDMPEAMNRDASWSRVIGAAAIQGLTFGATRAAVDRVAARGFEHFTGIWPGEAEQEGAPTPGG